MKRSKTTIINYPSDKNGCGFYRTILPFSYLSCVGNYESPFLTSFNFDITYLETANWVRFQRQVTQSQKQIIIEYKKMIQKNNFSAKLAYELDDNVHAIEPSNILAWQFYTKTRKDNLIEIMKMCDVTTFSTKFLVDFYKSEYGIENSICIPNYLPKYLWGNCGKRDKYNKGKKLRILWAGSASHIGKGGDMEFIIPLIKKTLNEFEWVFFGVCPFEIKNNVEFHNWADFFAYPQALDSINADIAICPVKDNVFNYGKSDLKLLEYTAIGLPAIFSAIGKGPYDEYKDKGIRVVPNNIDEWYNAIKEFENNIDSRIQALEAQKKILEKRWLENNISKYTNIFDM